MLCKCVQANQVRIFRFACNIFLSGLGIGKADRDSTLYSIPRAQPSRYDCESRHDTIVPLWSNMLSYLKFIYDHIIFKIQLLNYKNPWGGSESSYSQMHSYIFIVIHTKQSD